MAAGNNRPNRNQPNRNQPNRNQPNRNQGAGRLRNRAVTDVQLMMQPQFDYNNAQLQQAQENYLRAQQAAQSASGGAYDMIGEARNPGFDRIADQFTQNLNALAPEFGGAGAVVPYQQNSIYGERGGSIGMPENEVAASNALGGAIGSAGLSALANDDSRWGMLREGAQREASIFGRNSEAALRQQMLDTIQQHENEQQNLMAQQPWQIKSRLDELKDQAIEQQLARSKMRSDAAFSEALQAQLQGMLAGPSRSNRGPGGPGGPGGNPVGPGGGTEGFGLGDTAAGGNQGGPTTQWAGGSQMFPNRAAVRQGVEDASYLEDPSMPGWVRYAFRHGGAEALDNPARARFYENKLAELLERFRPPEIDITPGPFGF